MPDREPDVAESLLDLFVYAPIGLALDARELIPQLARRGKGQVDLARVVGTLALRQGKGELAKVVEALVDLLAASGVSIRPPGAAATEPSGTPDRPVSSGADPLDGHESWSAARTLEVVADLEPVDLRRLRALEEAGRNRVTVLRGIDRRLRSA